MLFVTLGLPYLVSRPKPARGGDGRNDAATAASGPADGGDVGRAPHVLAAAIEEGRRLSSMSGILADTVDGLLLS